VFSTGLAPSGGVLRRALCKWGVAVVATAGLAAGFSATALARTPDQPAEVVALASLPVEAQSTHRLILKGGPFPYPKDGIVFGNRERQLPAHPRGYYREYTVKTPGAVNRGPRRMVCGGQPPAPPAACYYTDDHYASFRLIVQ
jgi:ribonuclease T1